MEVNVQTNQHRTQGIFDRLSAFPAEWAPSWNYLRQLVVEVAAYYFTQPWPVTVAFKPNHAATLEIYSNVFNLCTQKQSRTERIYASFQEVLKEYLESRRATQFPTMDSVELYIRLWAGYKRLLELLLKMFCYLDRYYLPDSNLPVLEVKAMQIFQDAVLLPDKKALLYNCYFGRLHAYRSNYGSTDTMLLEFSRSLKDIGEKAAFDNDAELFDEYLKETNIYYEGLKSNWAELPCSAYLSNVAKLEQEEFVLFCKTVRTDTDRLAVLSDKFGVGMVKPYEQRLMSSETGLKQMLVMRDFRQLQLAARLLKSYHNIEALKKQFYKHERSQGFELFLAMPKGSEPVVVIRQFAQFYANQMAFTCEAFPQYPQLIGQCRNAMETVVHLNDQEFLIAENLASYTDKLFREECPNAEKEKEVLNVFECLGSKDVFMSIYEKDLSNRLLLNRCKSISQQTAFLQDIKQKCGQLFTQAAEGRIQDFTKALELQKQYKATRQQESFAYSLKVLSKNYWLSDLKIETDHKTFDFEWPPEVEHIKLDFERFYRELHTNKHLEYLPLLSTVKLVFPLVKGYCDITTNLLQASMVVFIDRVGKPVEMADLLRVFHGEEQLIRTHLEPLLGTLVESFHDTANPAQVVFKINRNFTTTQTHIEFCNQRGLKPMRKESINMERDMAVQSIIVKILKQEKRMDLYSLFERIDRSVKQFKPSMSMLKDSIEKLIEKDYVERDRHDQNVLVYKE